MNTDKYSMNFTELNSFKLSDAITFHDKLNPNLWLNGHLRPEVKNQLLLIADDFLEELGVSDLDVRDITVSGSNAAYSYTKHSDLDLHILVDMSDMPNDEVYKELFNAKKTLYNDNHDITVHGIPVELYVQDATVPVVSLGEYSLLHDKWLRIPTKRRANFDQTATKQKYSKLFDLISAALDSNDLKKVSKVLRKIKQYRQAGLDKGGEFGPENLAYKALRSQGYITKLYQLRDKLHSDILTIETMYQDPVKLLDKPTPTMRDVVKKFNVPLEHVMDQLLQGIKIESEHTSVEDVAREIALDHLSEDPNYYSKLSKVGLEEEKEPLPAKVYHVTPTRNLPSVMSHGLRPQVGDRSSKIPGEQSAIFCFPDKASLEDAMMNWLGDEFDEDEDLALLEISTSGLKGNVTPNAEYEIQILEPIPPQNIKVLSQNLATMVLEASGYIPSEKEKNDPRYCMALTVDVKPDSIEKNAKSFYWKTSRAGIPPTLNPSGKF